jgi:hypothetical protein
MPRLEAWVFCPVVSRYRFVYPTKGQDTPVSADEDLAGLSEQTVGVTCARSRG